MVKWISFCHFSFTHSSHSRTGFFCDRVILLVSRRHDSDLSLSQHRAYLLAVDALGVLDVRQPCAGHYVVEASYVATERIEESISHQVSPNVDEVLASVRVSTDTSRSVFEASSLLQFALVYRISRLLAYLLAYFEYLRGVYLEKALRAFFVVRVNEKW